MVRPSRCRICGLPVTGYCEDGDLTTLTPCGHTFRKPAFDARQFRPPPDTRPPVERTQLPPGSRPIQMGASLRDVVGDAAAAEFGEKQRAQRKAAEDRAREHLRSTDIYQRDLALILTALGLSDHARDYSPHEVVERDILPAIARLREPTREHFRTWPRDIPPSASSY